MELPARRVALVIGSGGIKCAAAIGLWRELSGQRVPIDLVVGCSGGSLYAASIALGYDAEAMERLTRNFWTAEIMKDYTANLRAAQDGTVRFSETSGLVDDSVLNGRLRSTFGTRTFADCRIPLTVVATDLMSGEKVEIRQGEVFGAVRASISIPTVFPPWSLDDRLLVDGAACDPLPVDIAIRERAELILAMGFKVDMRRSLRSLTGVQLQLTNIYSNNLLNASYSFHNLAHHAELIPIIPEFDGSLSMSDGHRLPEIIDRGQQATAQELPRILRWIEG